MQMTGQALQEEYMHIQVCTSGVDSVAATPQDSTYSIIVSFTVSFVTRHPHYSRNFFSKYFLLKAILFF